MIRFFENRGLLALILVGHLSCVCAGDELFPDVPGTVIHHSPASSGQYIGSPSIALLPDGSYVAAHDFFGSGPDVHDTRIYRSEDRGEHWQHVSTLRQFFSTLFVHRGTLYLIGRDAEAARAVIRKSEDGGRTWTTPVDRRSGILLRGRIHCAPVPVLEHDGRLWRAMECFEDSGTWAERSRAFMMSVPVDANLLNAEHWRCSEMLSYDQKHWKGMGWIEGNAVASPDGEVLNILRVARLQGKAAVIHVSDDGRDARFDPDTDYIRLPGSAKKFTIRFDPHSGRYWSITNHGRWYDRVRTLHPGWVRNRAVLISSPDLKHWTVHETVVQHRDVYRHGFQYWDWQFEGHDIIAVSRTAFDDGMGGAHNYHDANFLTFHRIENFRLCFDR
ncbi:sialidase family protein [Kiritimatiella glycovorans]|uniref:Glycosyl hydrolase n=1 Tax=Kiritimatiella glycovorans TaxID=1307763 RepID=A0A0G3EF23_9BACT|nr:sialidase family protein [Kiritimatiella glycovorans]AKJ65056.1 glycosyl hydrolase [Kiritimatiella glycovorans]